METLCSNMFAKKIISRWIKIIKNNLRKVGHSVIPLCAYVV